MFIKSGSVTRSERCAKYNRLILLEEIDKNLVYSGLEINEKFKLLLVAFLLPITFIIYYFTSEEFGISAYLDKQKSLEKINLDNNKIQNQIAYYKNKIKLLNNENPDLRFIK